MTGIDRDRPVIRETELLYFGKHIVVILHPKYIELRVKGKKDSVNVPYDAVLELGWKLRTLTGKTA